MTGSVRPATVIVGRFAAAALIVGACTLSRVARAEEGGSGAVSLLFHADLTGQLATPRCGKPGGETPDYAALVAALHSLRVEPAFSVSLLGGNAIAPDLFTRHLFERSREDAARFLATAFSAGRYDAFTIGGHELSLTPEDLDATVRALTDRGMPLVVTNLRCALGAVPDGRRQLCARGRSYAVVERAGRRVVVLATLSPRVLPGVPATRRVGIVLEEPLTAIRKALDEVRALGGDAVVLMAQVPSGRAGLDEMRDLQEGLGLLPYAPDVILAGGLYDPNGTEAVRLLRGDRSPPIVGSTAGTASAARVTLTESTAAGRPFDVNVQALASETAKRDPDVAALLAPYVRSYCETYGQPIGPKVRRAMTREDLLTYALGIMRKDTDAEIALLNRRFVKDRPFPITGAMTRAELYQAIPYRASMLTATVPGGKLASLLSAAAANPKAIALGFEINAKGAPSVNGRPIDSAREYRVVTADFVATGGDGILPPDAVKWRPAPPPADVRDRVEAFIRTRTAEEDGDATMDPRTDLGPPAGERALWVTLTDVGVDLSNITIDNGSHYGDPQLTRAEQRAARAELTSIGQLRALRHEADGRLVARYGWARTQPAGMAAVSAETVDLLTASVTYNYRGLRVRGGGAVRSSLIPDPYVRAMFESEITRPPITAMQTRTFHHAELTMTAGPLVALTPKLRVRAGPGFRQELLASGTAGRVRPLGELGLALSPIGVVTVGADPIRIEGAAEYLLIEPGSSREQQVRATARLSIPIAPLLFLTAGVDYFAVERRPLGWASAIDTILGLRIHLDAAYQHL